MKRLSAALLAATLIATPVMAQDTTFGWLGDATLKLRNTFRDTIPTEVVALEADGGNPRVYVYEAPGNPYYTCHFVAASNKGGPACVPNKEVTEALIQGNR